MSKNGQMNLRNWCTSCSVCSTNSSWWCCIVHFQGNFLQNSQSITQNRIGIKMDSKCNWKRNKPKCTTYHWIKECSLVNLSSGRELLGSNKKKDDFCCCCGCHCCCCCWMEIVKNSRPWPFAIRFKHMVVWVWAAALALSYYQHENIVINWC